MKKVISLLLSALLMLSVMPMMLASAKVEEQWQVMYDWEAYSKVAELPEGLVDVGTPDKAPLYKYETYKGMATITNATSYPDAQTNRLEGSVKAFNFQFQALQSVTGNTAYKIASKIKQSCLPYFVEF